LKRSEEGQRLTEKFIIVKIPDMVEGQFEKSMGLE